MCPTFWPLLVMALSLSHWVARSSSQRRGVIEYSLYDSRLLRTLCRMLWLKMDGTSFFFQVRLDLAACLDIAWLRPSRILLLVLTLSTARRRQPECHCQWLTDVPIVGAWLLCPGHRSTDMQPRLRHLWSVQRHILVVQQRSKQRLHLKSQR